MRPFLLLVLLALAVSLHCCSASARRHSHHHRRRTTDTTVVQQKEDEDAPTVVVEVEESAACAPLDCPLDGAGEGEGECLLVNKLTKNAELKEPHCDIAAKVVNTFAQTKNASSIVQSADVLEAARIFVMLNAYVLDEKNKIYTLYDCDKFDQLELPINICPAWKATLKEIRSEWQLKMKSWTGAMLDSAADKHPPEMDDRELGDNWPQCRSLLARNQGYCAVCWAFGFTNAIGARLCKQTKGFANVVVSAGDFGLRILADRAAEMNLVNVPDQLAGDLGFPIGNMYDTIMGGPSHSTPAKLQPDRCRPYACNSGGEVHLDAPDICPPGQPTSPQLISLDKMSTSDNMQFVTRGRSYSQVRDWIYHQLETKGPLVTQLGPFDIGHGPPTRLVHLNTESPGSVFMFKLDTTDPADRYFESGDPRLHVVTLVGWGTTTLAKESDGVAAGTPVPYWIFQNSWGEQWGVDSDDSDGYFYTLRGYWPPNSDTPKYIDLVAFPTFIALALQPTLDPWLKMQQYWNKNCRDAEGTVVVNGNVMCRNGEPLPGQSCSCYGYPSEGHVRRARRPEEKASLLGQGQTFEVLIPAEKLRMNPDGTYSSAD